MSLLDDVSIVVTPNGYKAGELYAVIPVPSEGAEEVTNGDFATDSDWSKATGVTISGGNAIFNNSTANNNGIYQAAVFQANTQYKITAEVSNYSSGNVTAWSGGSQNINSNESFTGNGTKTWIISTGASNGYILLSSATTNGNFNIDNVSVKEYTSADMDVTRATAATRVDENGLVNYAEVVSDTELVTNGDFSNGTTDWTPNAAATLSIDTGRLKIAISGAGSGYAHQTFTIESGKQYKCTGTIDFGTASQMRFYVSNTGQFFDITQSGNFDFTFTSTGTSTQVRLYTYGDGNYGFWDNISVKEVTRDNVPRIDYTGGGCPHILAEPQRTNIVFPSDVAVTQTRTVTAVAYALSFYGTGSIVLSGTHSATLTGTGVNDRVDLIFTPTAGSLVLTVSGTVTNFQLEVGSYATSLIPTVSGTVTRNQDIFTRDGIGSLINSTEGVLFVEMAALSDDLTYRSFMLNDGTDDNRMIIRYSNASNTLQALCYISTGLTGFCQYVLTDETLFSKIAFKWKVNDFALWVDGVEVATDTSGAVPTGLNTLEFKTATDTQHLLAKVKQLQVYDTSLSDTQLAALTSL